MNINPKNPTAHRHPRPAKLLITKVYIRIDVFNSLVVFSDLTAFLLDLFEKVRAFEFVELGFGVVEGEVWVVFGEDVEVEFEGGVGEVFLL